MAAHTHGALHGCSPRYAPASCCIACAAAPLHRLRHTSVCTHTRSHMHLGAHVCTRTPHAPCSPCPLVVPPSLPCPPSHHASGCRTGQHLPAGSLTVSPPTDDVSVLLQEIITEARNLSNAEM